MNGLSFVAPDVAWAGLVPVLLVIVASLVVLLVDAFVSGARRYLDLLPLAVLVAAFAMTLRFVGADIPAPFPGLYSGDTYAHLFDLLFYAAAIFVIGVSRQGGEALRRGEYHALVLLATAGMVALAHSTSLVTVFVSLELLSIALYALTGYLHERPRAAEAALKYFFLGAFSSAFVVYGTALVYGMTGSFDLAEIGGRLAGASGRTPMLLAVGAALLLSGFLFKISSVPFHMWTPDVYEGAPTPIAAFMSVGTKAAAFAALMRVLTQGLGTVSPEWVPAIAWIAAITMLVGNFIAVNQLNLKRLLAFSSVAHAGYGLLGLVAWDAGGREALLFYLIAYTAMNLGAFGMVAALERRGDGLFLRDLTGLAARRPYSAAALSLFLLSLAGVPPTAGFLAKFNIFTAAIEAGWVKLAIVAALYSAVAAYYYLRLIVFMYMRATPEGLEELQSIGFPAGLVLGGAALLVLYLGLLPSGIIAVVAQAVGSL